MIRGRNQRGAVLPSPVVLLSIVAVALAAVAFFVTRGEEPKEREITTASQDQGSDAGDDAKSDDKDGDEPTDEPTKKPAPVVHRDEVGVNVFNNSSVTGLASEVHARIADVGWNALAADNWYGTIPATTVYYPEGKKAAARLLALDLGIQRVVPAVGEMSTDNLTLILTGSLD